jgi:hypothetical protein
MDDWDEMGCLLELEVLTASASIYIKAQSFLHILLPYTSIKISISYSKLKSFLRNQPQCILSTSSPSSQLPRSPHSMATARVLQRAKQRGIIWLMASATTLRIALPVMAHTLAVVVPTMMILLRVA